MKIMRFPPNLYVGLTLAGPQDESPVYPLTFVAEDLLPTTKDNVDEIINENEASE